MGILSMLVLSNPCFGFVVLMAIIFNNVVPSQSCCCTLGLNCYCNMFGCACKNRDPEHYCWYVSTGVCSKSKERCPEKKRSARSPDRFGTDLASKYKHKPALRVMFNEQPFEVFSEIDLNADGLISYVETISYFEQKMGKMRNPVMLTVLSPKVNLKRKTLMGMVTYSRRSLITS